MIKWLFQFGLETFEQRECVSSAAGKPCENAIVKKASDLTGGRLQNHIAERDLAIATERDLLAAPNRQNGCSVHGDRHDD
jgi:hypothetical protein